MPWGKQKNSCLLSESVIISFEDVQMYFGKEQGKKMKDNRRYFVVTEKAVPDVLLKVVEAKRLLDIQQYDTVQEAVEAVGISRSSFYK